MKKGVLSVQEAGRRGGYVRAARLSKEQRSAIARDAVNARWAKMRKAKQEACQDGQK